MLPESGGAGPRDTQRKTPALSFSIPGALWCAGSDSVERFIECLGSRECGVWGQGIG